MAAAPRRVWVTRTQPAAATTAARLAELGLEAVVEPVLVVQPVMGAVLDLTGVDALAFTSRHGVEAFAHLSGERVLPVFAVGGATASAARAAGFVDVRPAGGDAKALAALIAESKPALVLAAVAQEPAADLDALLAGHGVPARAVAVYETVATGQFPDLAGVDAVLIHSARAAIIVSAHLAGRPEAGRLLACAISAAAAAPISGAGLAEVRVAARPTEAALLARLSA